MRKKLWKTLNFVVIWSAYCNLAKNGFVLIHVEINNTGAYKQDFRFAGIPTENYALQGIKISVFNILSVQQIVQIDLSNKKKMPSCLWSSCFQLDFSLSTWLLSYSTSRFTAEVIDKYHFYLFIPLWQVSFKLWNFSWSIYRL